LERRMSFMLRLKGRAPPEGWELLESTIEDFEAQMRDAVAEDHDGKRKNETTWRIHRIHFEKNRFIYDLMYKQQALSKDLVRGCCAHRGAGAQALPCAACALVFAQPRVFP
jgi:bud site selection protein 31